MTEFKRWDPAEASERYVEALQRLNMGHQGAARFFGVSKLTSMNWASGDARVPPVIGMFFELMLEYGLKPHAMYERLRKPDKNSGKLESVAEMTAKFAAAMAADKAKS